MLLLEFSRETELSGEKGRGRVCVCMYVEIYYKEWAHAIMEADKSPNLQSELASWRPRKS